MKKIIILSSLSLLLFGSCTKFNENNFPGYDADAKPKDIKNEVVALEKADYDEIAKFFLGKKTPADTINGNFIKTHRCFEYDSLTLEALPYLLNNKYLFSDPSSAAEVSFRSFNMDASDLPSSQRYLLLPEDYASMGTATGTPGKSNDFSSSVDPLYYLPIFLAKKYSYAKVDDEVAITYTYFFNTSRKQDRTEIFVFDGTKWSLKQSRKNMGKGEDNKWVFVNTLIYAENFEANLGAFTQASLLGELAWTWDTYKYAKATGYIAPANLAQDMWLISPMFNVSARNKLSLTFMQVARYSNDFANDFTLWVSTAPDNGTLNEADWVKVNIPNAFLSEPGAWTFKPSGRVNLNEYAGSANFRFAFRYRSSTVKAGTWEVKEVLLEEK